MTTHSYVNLFVPRTDLKTLSVPPLSVIDGSSNPEWVDLPCLTGWSYSRPTILRLPVDAETASRLRRWIRFRRLDLTALRPALLAVGVVSFSLLFLTTEVTDRKSTLSGLTLLAAYWLGLRWARRTASNLTTRTHPEVFNHSGVIIPEVPHDVAQEWVRRNSGVRTMDEIAASGTSSGVRILAVAIVGTALAIILLPDTPTTRIFFAAVVLWGIAGAFFTPLILPVNLRRK